MRLLKIIVNSRTAFAETEGIAWMAGITSPRPTYGQLPGGCMTEKVACHDLILNLSNFDKFKFLA